MRIKQFPGCCTAKICHDFGGSYLSAGITSDISKEKIADWLNKKIKEFKGEQCLVIITNKDQEIANAVLLELGFKHSRWMSKKLHPESKIRLWWKEP